MNQPEHAPHQDQIWEVADTCDAHIQYLFTAPITFDGRITLAAGERVRITTVAVSPPPTTVDFLPVRYAELHDSLVPPDIRDTPRYQRYALSVATGYFNQHFRLVEATGDASC